MRKNLRYWALATVLCLTVHLHAQLVITEIMYNPPESGTDSLEYIELYNNSDVELNITDYSISDGIEYTFGNMDIPANGYIVIANNAAAMEAIFGITAIEWTAGALKNGGETIEIIDADSMVVDAVDYDDIAPWPTLADGDGYSLELCDPSADNADGFNWRLSSNATGVLIDGIELSGSPGAANQVACEQTAEVNDIIVTEVLYHAPNDDNTLEFFEIYNRSTKVLNLNGWTISGDVSHTIADIEITPAESITFSNSSESIMAVFGANSIDWTEGNLNDQSGSIQLFDAAGNMVTSLAFTNAAPWPMDANGTGLSIELCDNSSDQTTGSDWQSSSILNSYEANGATIKATPGEQGACLYSIDEISQNDTDGRNTSVGTAVRVRGVIYGNNLRAEGLEHTLIDIENDGISIINFNDNFGVDIQETDEVVLEGIVDQFNGQAQIIVDTLIRENTNALLTLPTEVSAITESEESQLITIKDVTLVNSSDWTGLGSGFAVAITNGVDTFSMWIDDQIDLFTLGYPDGTFNVTGLGRQFDTSSPYDSGYQIAPRYQADITPYNPVVIEAPSYTIGEVNKVNEAGVADSLDIVCQLTGIVHGINYRGSGLSFTLIDENHEGIVVFSDSESLGYNVQEADQIEVIGVIAQFQGLTEIIPSEINFISFENPLQDAILVDSLSEETESKLIRLNGLTLTDNADWLGDGSTFNVTAIDDSGNTHLIRIDNDTEVSSSPIPSQPFDVIGLGSQFDPSEPYTAGYQLFPRYNLDIISGSVSTKNEVLQNAINIFPNPTSQNSTLVTELDVIDIKLYDIQGRFIKQLPLNKNLELRNLPEGQYSIALLTTEGMVIKKLIKI